LPSGLAAADVQVRGESIGAVLDYGASTDAVIVDANERWVLPGLVETHAHINEPGRTDWEGFATATRAAAAGGITTLIDMPLNSSPVTTTVDALRQKQDATAGKLMVDVGFHAGIVPGNSGDLRGLIAAGVVGFKAFLCHSGIDDFPNTTEADLRQAMPALAEAGAPLLVHAEWLSPLDPAIDEAFSRQPRSYRAYLASRPASWETDAIARMIDLCREFGGPVHIVHLAAARAARAMIAGAKAEGLPLTVETCPHYLTFAAEEIPDGDPRFKCAPPIREQADRDLLRAMVKAREIDTIGSDHSPAPPALKRLEEGEFRGAWGGIASLQLLLPACWTAVDDRAAVIDALTIRPARLAGLADRKGAIAPGLDADLVVFDPREKWTVAAKRLEHRHPISPYDGQTLAGRVHATFLRGRLVYDGVFPAPCPGRIVERSR
jgi:allantoinase